LEKSRLLLRKRRLLRLKIKMITLRDLTTILLVLEMMVSNVMKKLMERDPVVMQTNVVV